MVGRFQGDDASARPGAEWPAVTSFTFSRPSTMPARSSRLIRRQNMQGRLRESRRDKLEHRPTPGRWLSIRAEDPLHCWDAIGGNSGNSVLHAAFRGIASALLIPLSSCHTLAVRRPPRPPEGPSSF